MAQTQIREQMKNGRVMSAHAATDLVVCRLQVRVTKDLDAPQESVRLHLQVHAERNEMEAAVIQRVFAQRPAGASMPADEQPVLSDEEDAVVSAALGEFDALNHDPLQDVLASVRDAVLPDVSQVVHEVLEEMPRLAMGAASDIRVAAMLTMPQGRDGEGPRSFHASRTTSAEPRQIIELDIALEGPRCDCETAGLMLVEGMKQVGHYADSTAEYSLPVEQAPVEAPLVPLPETGAKLMHALGEIAYSLQGVEPRHAFTAALDVADLLAHDADLTRLLRQPVGSPERNPRFLAESDFVLSRAIGHEIGRLCREHDNAGLLDLFFNDGQRGRPAGIYAVVRSFTGHDRIIPNLQAGAVNSVLGDLDNAARHFFLFDEDILTGLKASLQALQPRMPPSALAQEVAKRTQSRPSL